PERAPERDEGAVAERREVGERLVRDRIDLRGGERKLEGAHFAHLVDVRLVAALDVTLSRGALRGQLRVVRDRCRGAHPREHTRRAQQEQRNDGDHDRGGGDRTSPRSARQEPAHRAAALRSSARCAAIACATGDARSTRSTARTLSRRMWSPSAGWWSSLPRLTRATGRSVVVRVAVLK